MHTVNSDISARTTPLRIGLAALFAVALTFVATTLIAANAPSDSELAMDPAIADATTRASLVVVARVLGLVDKKPAAQDRRAREAHRVLVEETLKGGDATGTELIVRPANTGWGDGERHILFLVVSAEPMARALTTPQSIATQANVDAMRALIADSGAGVEPATVFRAEVVQGWRIEPINALLIRRGGATEWHHMPTEGVPSTQTGVVSEADITALIEHVESTPTGPMADDGGTLRVRWLDADGKERRAHYSLLDNPPAVALVQALKTLAKNLK
jgi:hypothetical protein